MKDANRQLSNILSHLDAMLDHAEAERIGATKEWAAHIRVLRVLDHYEDMRSTLKRIADMAGDQPALMSEEGLRAMSRTVGGEARTAIGI